jgi:hypothetical protein
MAKGETLVQSATEPWVKLNPAVIIGKMSRREARLKSSN